MLHVVGILWILNVSITFNLFFYNALLVCAATLTVKAHQGINIAFVDLPVTIVIVLSHRPRFPFYLPSFCSCGPPNGMILTVPPMHDNGHMNFWTLSWRIKSSIYALAPALFEPPNRLLVHWPFRNSSR